MRIFIMSLMVLLMVNVTVSEPYTAYRSVHPIEDSQFVKTEDPPIGQAVIYVGQFFNHGVYEETASLIYIDGKYIGRVGNKSFVYTIVEPGTYKITAKGLFEGIETIRVKAGEKYYISQCRSIGPLPWFGYWLDKIELEEIGGKRFNQCQLSTDCKTRF